MVSPCSECLLTPRESHNTDTHQCVRQAVCKRKPKAQRGNAHGKKQQLSREEVACVQSPRQGCEEPPGMCSEEGAAPPPRPQRQAAVIEAMGTSMCMRGEKWVMSCMAEAAEEMGSTRQLAAVTQKRF